MGHEGKSTAIRPEWEELDAIPIHPDCPFVRDVDVASDALEHALEEGCISRQAAALRLGVLNVRRIIIKEAQYAYGCPLMDKPEDGEPVCGASLNCPLPIGRIETLGFGDTRDGITNALSTTDKGNTGF